MKKSAASYDGALGLRTCTSANLPPAYVLKRSQLHNVQSIIPDGNINDTADLILVHCTIHPPESDSVEPSKAAFRDLSHGLQILPT